MNVTYIHHSCFLTETGSCYYLFDYDQGPLPALNRRKPILVLASHGHSDHYRPAVFSILREMGMVSIHAVLSRDIPLETVPGDIPCTAVSACERDTLPQGQRLVTFRSTDEGVAFLIQDGQELIYHAGDLNDWVWEGEPDADNRRMTESYRRQITLLAEELGGRSLTAAFVVLDPRQEKDYDRGMLYFLRHIGGNRVYPMHYWGNPRIIDRFLQEHPQYRSRIMLTEQAHSESTDF